MPTPSSFNMVPQGPFRADEMEEIRAKLESYPAYHEPADDLYVLFGSLEEQRETVALYTRNTTPTFDLDSFVQLRPDKLLVHPGGDAGGVRHLREFVEWLVASRPVQLIQGGVIHDLEILLPTPDEG